MPGSFLPKLAVKTLICDGAMGTMLYSRGIPFGRCFDELNLSHPDLIKNFTAEAWQPEQIMDDICSALDRIAACGVAMELNTSGVNKTISEMNPMPTMLAEMSARGIPVTLGSDAHVPERVADGFESALSLLSRCGFSHVSYFLERQRRDVSIEEALESLVMSASS